ncbi:hypothetical protein [Schlesneria sp. T3-172]|uniref:hypothetical protein n=1 Tax=Schlesneria sphaerica TaxID=3373610 RepID=UPI0037C7D62D
MNLLLHIGRMVSLVGFCTFLFASSPVKSIAESPRTRTTLQVIQDRHQERFREFSQQLEKLAVFCDGKSLTEAAELIRSRIIVPDSQSLRVDKLPTEVRPEIPAGVVGDERYWQTQLRNLESEYAKDLYKQSRGALHQGFPGYAYNLVREAAIHDPDHAQVRKILGFVRLGKEWVTPFAFSQIVTKGNVWNEEFGWLPRAHVDRYIAGERKFKDRWISAEKEKELRRDFSSAWEIRTDHYQIKTNVSLEQGVAMGKALEDFYGVFHETFAGFFHTPEQLQKVFDGTAKSVRVDKPYTVHFYRTREEYLNRLRKFFPSIDQTNGVYMTSDKVAHFYHDPMNDNEGTLFHEATHQLFFESNNVNRTISERSHFWIIEGIACYMESFRSRNGSFSLGDPKYIRFVGARHNLLEKGYYVPLREFSSYGMQDFQSSVDLAKNYTQAAGLARFFMHYDNGRYREAIVKHLSQLYSSDERTRTRASSLDELTGVDFVELDQQYAEDARATEEILMSR